MKLRLKQASGMLALTFALTAPGLARGTADLVGLDKLMARLGANTPTGAGVVVAQVEGLEGVNYGPDQSDPEFVGKTFVAQNGPPGLSFHANLVAQNYFGTVTSIAPGISTIYLYEANGWIQTTYLRTGQGAGNPPLTTPGQIKIMNNSWGGTTNNTAIDNEIMRRADFVISRDNIIMVHGMPNVGQAFPLMNHSFNGLAVGLTNGVHAIGTTGGSYDGPGRFKPDILAPSSLTSFGTPIVSGAAALMVQTARTVPSLSGNPNAQRSEVIKGVLMCGANRRSTWTNNPITSGGGRGITSTPLDSVFGADSVEVNVAHLILTGNEQNGSASAPASPNAGYRGWDLAPIAMGGSSYYRFNVNGLAKKVTMFATWHRKVNAANLTTYDLANVNLQLWRSNGAGPLLTLVGNAGLPYFSGGNVVSNSTIENVELLHIQNLQPGNYTLQVQRTDAVAGSYDVAVAWMIPRPGDVNSDGVTNLADLLAVISQWGPCSGCSGDINNDGVVNLTDLLLVIANWGG